MSVAVGGERRTEASALLNLMRMWIFVGRTMALLCLRWPVNSHRHRISTRMTIYWLRLKRRYAIAAEEESLNAKGRGFAKKNDEAALDEDREHAADEDFAEVIRQRCLFDSKRLAHKMRGWNN